MQKQQNTPSHLTGAQQMATEQYAGSNCPFYGCHYVSNMRSQLEAADPPFTLISSNGNQCALITSAHAPCRMEIAGETPDWKTCPVVKLARTL